MTTDHTHLDAETVAAWMDGGLDATSLAAAEAHASNCERCQALLAAVASMRSVAENRSNPYGARSQQLAGLLKNLNRALRFASRVGHCADLPTLLPTDPAWQRQFGPTCAFVDRKSVV